MAAYRSRQTFGEAQRLSFALKVPKNRKTSKKGFDSIEAFYLLISITLILYSGHASYSISPGKQRQC
jgi:hypothetical protein